ncbi:MAG TPA: hypothetical protein VHT03_03460 [Rhizomicrobium sp.]|jgi:hypothetical protein|nr:hypothetical protein [Rhizomicrobium sp.]
MPIEATRGSALLRRLFWFAIGVSTLTAAYAIVSARGLVYDGSFYLMAIAGDGKFHLLEPARLSVQFLQQLPAVLGARVGIADLWSLGRLFSLGMYGWPVVLTVLCWVVLPRGEKSWIAGPLVNLVFAIPAASFIGISEGLIASCMLWVAVLLVMFRLGDRVGAVAALVTTAMCGAVHEEAALCLLLIGWFAAAQFASARGFSRFASAGVAMLAVAGACNMAHWIVTPRSAIERGDFLVSLLGGFAGSPAAPNLSAIAAMVAALSIPMTLIARRQSVFVAVAGVIAVLACGIAFASAPDALAAPSRFFAARGLPVLLTTIIACIFLILRRRGTAPARFVTWPGASVFVALVVSQSLMQVIATDLWRDYVRDLRALVGTGQGVISHSEALEALNRDGSRFRRELLQSWSVQPLSILLAPAGRVRAVVEPAETERWVPYDTRKPQMLPRAPELDWSHFVARSAA